MNDQLERARGGDRAAFDELMAPFRAELLLHCYRMLGSYQDAEDALQETMLAAWLGLAGFEGRSSLRTWLYRVATTRSLNHRRSSGRRERREAISVTGTAPATAVPQPTGSNEVVWLQPFPDAALDEVGDDLPGPEAVYERREAVSLALIRLLQLLPPQQRAVLILRDVLGYRARQVAELLDITEDAANGSLKRARATVAAAGGSPDEVSTRTDGTTTDDELHRRFTAAFLSGDIERLVALFTDDVWLRMPPLTLEYQGREACAAFFTAIESHWDAVAELVPVGCNAQPAWGEYVRDAAGTGLHLSGILVADLRDGAISALTHFDTGCAATLGLPRTITT